MRTVGKECVIEFEEKKSKFIGYIKPVSTKEKAVLHEPQTEQENINRNNTNYEEDK